MVSGRVVDKIFVYVKWMVVDILFVYNNVWLYLCMVYDKFVYCLNYVMILDFLLD